MFYAVKKDGIKVRADKLSKNETVEVYCPICNQELIARRGAIKAWHFAHKSNMECDSWSEGETKWHLDWKNSVDEKYCEVVIECEGVKHRADIKNSNNLVIELQHSPILISEISEREAFYERMIWLFDATNHAKKISVYNKKPIDDIFTSCFYRWSNPHNTLLFSTKLIFFDLGDGYILSFLRGYDNSYKKNGSGILISKCNFIEGFLRNVSYYKKYLNLLNKIRAEEGIIGSKEVNVIKEVEEKKKELVKNVEKKEKRKEKEAKGKNNKKSNSLSNVKFVKRIKNTEKNRNKKKIKAEIKRKNNFDRIIKEQHRKEELAKSEIQRIERIQLKFKK